MTFWASIWKWFTTTTVDRERHQACHGGPHLCSDGSYIFLLKNGGRFGLVTLCLLLKLLLPCFFNVNMILGIFFVMNCC